jgi:ABC-type branched-subunit amino acid transport system ATPase component
VRNRVIVMDFGEKLAEGDPGDIMRSDEGQ